MRSIIRADSALERVSALAVILLLSACANKSPANAPEPPNLMAAAPAVVTPPPSAPVVPAAPPAEAVLSQGLKAYQAGQYTIAETQFNTALQAGLKAPTDVATAHKYLAFIYCTSRREVQCAKAFKAARAADPGFALSKSEAGHPMWGPVYRKALPPAKAAKSGKKKVASKPPSAAAVTTPRP